jgi:hypothetical protein
MAFSPKSRLPHPTKSGRKVPLENTMVHGDGNTSLPKMAYVSRYPCCLGVVVFVCLLAFPSPQAQATALTNTPLLVTGDVTESSPQDALPALAGSKNAAHQPQPFWAAMFHRPAARTGKPGEALSEALVRGRLTAQKACTLTMRCARLTGRQRLRGAFSRGSDPEVEGPPFALWEGFPPTARFS